MGLLVDGGEVRWPFSCDTQQAYYSVFPLLLPRGGTKGIVRRGFWAFVEVVCVCKSFVSVTVVMGCWEIVYSVSRGSSDRRRSVLPRFSEKDSGFLVRKVSGWRHFCELCNS